MHATAEHNDEEMEEDEVEHHEEEETQEDVHSHQDEDETHQVIARMDVSDGLFNFYNCFLINIF